MAIPFNIDQLKARLQGGGARSNLFSVQLNNPVAGTFVDGYNGQFLIHAAKLPEVELGTIEVPYMGRKLRLPGDRTFPAWTVSIINDENFALRTGFENWINAINDIQNNVRSASAATLDSLKSSATITQYSKTGNAIKSYTFAGLFPNNISEIGLDWNTTDQIEYFQVSFMYDYWTTNPTTVTSVTTTVGL